MYNVARLNPSCRGLGEDILESLKCLELEATEDELKALGFKPNRLLAALDSVAGERRRASAGNLPGFGAPSPIRMRLSIG